MLFEVAVPFPRPGTLTYELPSGMGGVVGTRVLVPLGTRRVIGCLVSPSKSPPPRGLKKVLELLDEEPLLSPVQIKLLEWASHYYLAPLGEVLRHLLPGPLLKKKIQPVTRKREIPQYDDFAPPHPIELNEEQRKIVEKILGSPPAPFLLKGITGSGKTEVYIELARKMIEEGKQVLVLVPEIGLTPQLIGRFQKGLGLSPHSETILSYHSGLSDGERSKGWFQVRSGETPVVVGTRSAVFLPFRRLGLIVVDEEHDPSYKQEGRFCYNARDLALWRGREEGATVLLGSATPSLETLERCHQGKMGLLTLPKRAAGASPPDILLVDRRFLPKGGPILSDDLKREISLNLGRGEQTLLFLNRRGFSPIMICPSCGFIPRCRHCEISLTYHKRQHTLSCHYCDLQLPPFETCPSCRSTPLRPEGVGTERIENELRDLFPRARIARLDRDSVRHKGLVPTLAQMKRGEIDILIGTQMVAKGHDYPNLTLVGIVDADTGLNLPDFRAAERTFQLLMQVAGRSGRSEKAGRVLIQTFHPEHPGLQAVASHDGEHFLESELKNRKELNYPPFCRLVRIILSGSRSERVERAARDLSRRLSNLKAHLPGLDFHLLGPAPCPLARIRSKTRWHLLIKCREFAKVTARLKPLLDEVSRSGLPSGVRMNVDVDPVDMM